MPSNTLTPDLLQRIDAYWRAANYLSVGQIYLYDNPLLRRPLALTDVKHMLLGHWGTTPGQNFIYAHLNRVIKQPDLDMVYLSGPGHGSPALVANTYLEGTYSEIYPDVSQDEDGLRRLFRQFSFPGGIPSHVSPACPGSIHEGGELGYSLSHAFGAVFDNPELIVACVIGDGEAETGALATAWHSNKFLDPVGDGAVLPILHLNGYKIANPTLLARIPHEGLEQISQFQQRARSGAGTARPRWPMIVLRSPKGWTGPKLVDGLPNEGSFRSHQVPISVSASAPPGHLQLLEDWLRSYRPDELFDEDGRLLPELAELAPAGTRRMGANPHANGGLLLRDLRLPDFREYALAVPQPGVAGPGDTRVLGRFLRDVTALNEARRNFRLFGPDETLSNGLDAVFEVTARQWNAETRDGDVGLAPSGRIMEMLSEHQCEGWLRLSADRPPRPVQLLRGLHPHHRFDVQPARQMAEGVGRTAVAAADCLAQLPADLARLAPGPQRLHPPGSRFPRPRGQQEGQRGARLPAAGRQLPAVGDGPLPAQPPLRQRGHRRQAPVAAVAGHGRGRQALRGRHRHLGLGRQRPRRRSRRRDGLLRRRADARNAGGRGHPARRAAGINNPRGQRGRPDAAAAAGRASARPERRRFRRVVQPRQAGDLRLPRLSVAGAPPDLPAPQPPQHPRARLQGGGHDHDAIRHDGAQRARPLPPGDGRHRPPAADGRGGPGRQAQAQGQAGRAPALHLPARHGHAGSARLALAGRAVSGSPYRFFPDAGTA